MNERERKTRLDEVVNYLAIKLAFALALVHDCWCCCFVFAFINILFYIDILDWKQRSLVKCHICKWKIYSIAE